MALWVQFITGFLSVLQQGLEFEPSKTCAVMVGHKEMCEAVTKILESKGVSKEHILLNF